MGRYWFKDEVTPDLPANVKPPEHFEPVKGDSVPEGKPSNDGSPQGELIESPGPKPVKSRKPK